MRNFTKALLCTTFTGLSAFATAESSTSSDASRAEKLANARFAEQPISPVIRGGATVCPGTLSLTDPQFNRTTSVSQGGSCALSGVGTAVRYRTQDITVSAANNIIVSLLAADGGFVTPADDTYLLLYPQNQFNPAAACSNIIAANDDAGGDLQSRIATTTPLAAGSYTVVVTSFENNANLPWSYGLALSNATCGASGLPTITDISDQFTFRNVRTLPIGFTIGDSTTPAANLQVSATSSNQTLIPDGNILLTGTGASRQISFTPAAEQTGNTTITVTVTDGDGLTTSDSFNFEVYAPQTTDVQIYDDAPDASLVGQPYQVTVEVFTPINIAVGTVQVSDGAGASCAITLTDAPTARGHQAQRGGGFFNGGSCMLTSTQAGARTLTATFPSSAQFAGGSGTASHQVNTASTFLEVYGPATTPAGLAQVNRQIRYTTFLQAVGPAGGNPNGVVTITANTGESCSFTAPTSNSCFITYTTLGARTLSAVFVPADYNYTGQTASTNSLVYAATELSVSKDNGVTTYRPGTVLSYQISVRNAGPDAASAIRLLDNVPAELTSVSWQCQSTPTVNCSGVTPAAGTASLSALIARIPANGVANFILTGTVSGEPASIANTATVELPADGSIIDANNYSLSATDTDTLGANSPTVTVSNPSVIEGNSGTTLMNFVVSLSGPSTNAISFDFLTVDGTATSGSDFDAGYGSASIPAGQTSTTVPVIVRSDTNGETNETLQLSLNSIVNAANTMASGTGTIRNDDLRGTTTTITGSTPAPSVVGQSYTVQVSVEGEVANPIGIATVSDGSQSCVATISGSANPSTGSCALASMSAGSKTLTASFTPTNPQLFQPSQGTRAHVVNPAATTITVQGAATSNLNASVIYAVTVAATAPGGGVPTGTVTVTSGSQSCSLSVPGNSNLCPLTFQTVGSKTVDARFTPSNGNHTASNSSTPALTLVQANTLIKVSKSNGISTYRANDLLVYTIIVRNSGIDRADGLNVIDNVPASLTNVSWSCSGSSVLCPVASGTGNLNAQVDLPQNTQVTYVIRGNVLGKPLTISNTAMVRLPAANTIVNSPDGVLMETDTDILDDLFNNGFEDNAPIANPEKALAADGAAFKALLSAVAQPIYSGYDARGVETQRIYARLLNNQVQIAVAKANTYGVLELGEFETLE
jgi:uncharacterized repeat protein (TIGR01451 family)